MNHSMSPESLRQRPRGWYRYVRLRWHLLFAVIDGIGWLLFGPTRLVQKIVERRSHNSSPRAILVVQLDHIGDSLLTTGMLHVLKRHHPHAALHVLAGPWNREVFDHCPAVDQVHLMQSPRFGDGGPGRWIADMLRWGWLLRKRRYDLAFDTRGDFPHAVLMWLAAARRRVGWHSGGGGFLNTDCVPYDPFRHEVRSRTALLNKIGLPVEAKDLAPRFEVAEVAQREIDRRLAAARLQLAAPPRGTVVLHIGAGTPSKLWPAEHWYELAGRLVVEHGVLVILVGTESESPLAAAISEGGRFPAVEDWTGRLDLPQLAALLRSANVMIGPDSGPGHMATAVGTPVVTLYSGAGYSEKFRPWGERLTLLQNRTSCTPCNRTVCPLAGHPCMRELEPKEVARQAAKWLPAEVEETRHPAPVERNLFRSLNQVN